MKRTLEAVKGMVDAYISLGETFKAAETDEEKTNIDNVRAVIGKMIDSDPMTRVMADMLMDEAKNSRGMIQIGGVDFPQHDVAEMLEALKAYGVVRFAYKIDTHTDGVLGLAVNAGYAIDYIDNQKETFYFVKNPDYNPNKPEFFLKI